jgi:predicted SnoaL-like aldol condensation-catalyzing enzyme
MTLAVALQAIALAIGVRANTPQELANRKTVLAFYEQAFGEKDVAAARQYLGSGYIEHDPSIADGPDGLSTYLTRLKDARPRSRHEVTQVVAEGDQVVLHVHVVDARVQRIDGPHLSPGRRPDRRARGMTQAYPTSRIPTTPTRRRPRRSRRRDVGGHGPAGPDPGSAPQAARHRLLQRGAQREELGESRPVHRAAVHTQHSLYAPMVPAGFAIWSTV